MSVDHYVGQDGVTIHVESFDCVIGGIDDIHTQLIDYVESLSLSGDMLVKHNKAIHLMGTPISDLEDLGLVDDDY